jgi:hypothetical protein
MSSDIIAAIGPVVAAFETLGVLYRIGGSVASSALGVPRSTLDVDVVCDLQLRHVPPLVAALQEAYYVDGDMMRDAIRNESSFNLVHLSTMLKVDVFVRKSTPWDLEAFSRKIRRPLDVAADGPEFDLTTAEDIVLHKLAWFRLGEGVSERQWRDAVGVIAVQGQALDRAYLMRWAASLGLGELLDRAFAEAQAGG